MTKDYNHDVHEKEKNRISSGETELVEQIQGEWYKLYGADEAKADGIPQRWSYEQVIEDPKIFLDAIKEIKVIPAYRYVINYLLEKTQLEIGKSNQRAFADYIAQGKFDDVDESGFQQMWQILISRLDNLYLQNGYKEKMEWKKFFSDMVVSFPYDFDESFEFLKNLALGVHMKLGDFEIFLTKVLKRSSINFYKRDEIFVHLTLKYADECGHGAYYEAYERLCELYPPKEKVEKPEGAREEDTVSTRTLKNELQTKISQISGSVFEGVNAELEDYLDYVAWQRKRLQDREISRTAKKRFSALWNGLKERWDASGELNSVIRSEREKRKKNDVSCRELTVVYNPEVECILPAGTEFKAETQKASIKGKRTAVFRLAEEQILPAVKTESVEVKVKALMTETEFASVKKVLSVVGKKPQFMKEQFFDNLENENRVIREENEKNKKSKPEIAFSKMKVCSKELKKDIENIEIGEKLRFSEANGKGNEGILLIECKIGTPIPKGTQFCFEIKGVEFRYESLEDVNTGAFEPSVHPLQEGDEKGKVYAVAKVNAIWENMEEFQKNVSDKSCTFLKANAKFTHELENIYEVNMEKKVTLKPVTAQSEQKEDYNVSDNLLLRLIYDTSEEVNAYSAGYYQKFSEYDEDYLLNSRLFKDTRIVRGHISSPPVDEERLRNLILTLKFLEYVWWNEEIVDYDAEGVEYVIEDFLKDNGTDEELIACGFHSFSTTFPYDAFLKFLLNSDDPLALFQAVWSDKPLLRKEK